MIDIMNTPKRTVAIAIAAIVLAGCASTPVDNDAAIRTGLDELFAGAPDEGKLRVAVLPLLDFRTESRDELGAYIANDVMYQISASYADRVQMVERELITQLMEELELNAMSGMISDADVKEIGEMSGADVLIIGTKLETENSIQANLRLVYVESAEILGVTRFDLAINDEYAALMGAGVPTGVPTGVAAAEPSRDELAAGALTGTSVSILGVFGEANAERFEAAIAPFEEETGIDIVYSDSPNLTEEISRRVRDGNAPDIVAVPQPGLVAQYVASGDIYDAEAWLGSEYLRDQYDDKWLQLARIGGIQAGVWYRTSIKSLVWYNRAVFDREAYEIPATWDQLRDVSDRMIRDGYTPWAIGIESGFATSWVATDWIEDIMLRIHAPDVYDRWIDGDVRFDSPDVRDAFSYLEEIWFDPEAVLGGRDGIVSTSFSDSIRAIIDDPPSAILHRQGSFILDYVDLPMDRIDETLRVFYLPPIDPAIGTPILDAGDLMCAMHDRPEVRAVLRHLSTGESARRWIESGGFVSPHADTPLEWYPTEINREIARIVGNASHFRFDASDSMPADVGSGTFWSGMTEYVADEDADLGEILRAIDASYPR
jgi:alpha-glucoside transport system substrate-binding protein